MSRWRGMASVAWLLFTVGPVIGEPQLGKYLCITDYSAGIILQPDGSLAAGQIKAPTEKQKFFVTIRADLARDFESRREGCFSKEQAEALKYEPPPHGDKLADWLLGRYLARDKTDEERRKADPNYISPPAMNPNQFIEQCLANFDADVADHRYLHSFDGTTFSDYDAEVVFRLFGAKGAFHLYEHTLGSFQPTDFNDIVYRGRCEFIQATP
jgi:hypothetical protein